MLLAHVAHGHLGWGGNSPFGEEILRDVDVFADEVFHIESSTDRESSIKKRRTMHIGHGDLAHLNVRHSRSLHVHLDRLTFGLLGLEPRVKLAV